MLVVMFAGYFMISRQQWGWPNVGDIIGMLDQPIFLSGKLVMMLICLEYGYVMYYFDFRLQLGECLV